MWAQIVSSFFLYTWLASAIPPIPEQYIPKEPVPIERSKIQYTASTTILSSIPNTISHTTNLILTASEASEQTQALKTDSITTEPPIPSSITDGVGLYQIGTSEFCDLEGTCSTSLSSVPSGHTATSGPYDLTASVTVGSTITAHMPTATTIMTPSNQNDAFSSQHATVDDADQTAIRPQAVPALGSSLTVESNSYTGVQEKSRRVTSGGALVPKSSTTTVASNAVSQEPQGTVLTRSTVDLSTDAESRANAASVTAGSELYTSVESNTMLAIEAGSFIPEKTSIATSFDALSSSAGNSHVASRIVSVPSTAPLTRTALPTTTETKPISKAKESEESAANGWPIGSSLSLWRGITWFVLTFFVLSL